MITAEVIDVIIKGLTFQVTPVNFEEDFIKHAVPFTILGKVNKVSNKEAAAVEIPPGKLRDFLKNVAKTDQKDKEEDRKIKKGKKRTTKAPCSSEPPLKAAKGSKESPLMAEDSDEEIDLNSEEVTEAIDHLNSFFEKDNLKNLEKVLDKSQDEGELEIGLGIHLISKLAGKASTNIRKCKRTCPCGCGGNLQGNASMWIGSKDTWYGELDIIAGNPATGNAVAVTIESKELETPVDENDSDEESGIESEGSPGDRTNVEVKWKISGSNQDINQLVSQAIVFAYTEYNRHEDKGKCIPSVLIDNLSYRFVIYSPVDDKLVVSDQVVYNKKEKKEFTPQTLLKAILVLWLVLNHRIFFSKSPRAMRNDGYLKSKFHEKMENLKDFQNLRDYSSDILPKTKFKFDSQDGSLNAIDIETYDWLVKRKYLA